MQPTATMYNNQLLFTSHTARILVLIFTHSLFELFLFDGPFCYYHSCEYLQRAVSQAFDTQQPIREQYSNHVSHTDQSWLSCPDLLQKLLPTPPRFGELNCLNFDTGTLEYR